MALCFVSYNNIVVNRMAFGVLQPVMARNESGLIGGLDAESYGDALALATAAYILGKLFLTPAVDAAVGGRLGLILSCLFTAAFTAGMSTATNSVALTAWYCAGRYVSLSLPPRCLPSTDTVREG